MTGIPKGLELPPVRPQNDRVLIYLEPESNVVGSDVKLYKPDDANAHVFRLGRVVRVGPGKRDPDSGERIPCMVKPGDRVLFIKFVATHTKTAESIQCTVGKDFALIKDYDALAVVPEDFDLRMVRQ